MKNLIKKLNEIEKNKHTIRILCRADNIASASRFAFNWCNFATVHPTSFRVCLVGFRGQRMQLATETEAVTAPVNFFIKFLKITYEQQTPHNPLGVPK